MAKKSGRSDFFILAAVYIVFILYIFLYYINNEGEF